MRDELRVAYLLPDPGIPVGGTKGASVHVSEVCRALVASGASVTLLAQRVVEAPSDGVDTVLLDPGPMASGPEGELARMASGGDFARRSAKVLRYLKPDLVYERLSLFFSSGGDLANAVRAARLVEVNAPIAAERERHFGLAHLATAVRHEHRALAGAHAMVVSQPLAQWALQRGAAEVDVIPNGVDTDRFEPVRNATAAGDLRKALGLSGTDVVGFVGSMKPWHGTDVLLDACRRLKATRPALRLLVVGEGPMRVELEAFAKVHGMDDTVIFTGPVPHEQIPVYLAALDVATAPFLASDDFYFSPLKVLEAMAAGLPIVASRLRTVASLLGGTGLLVEPGDAGSLATGLDRLLSDRELADRLGSQARRRTIESFKWDRVADHILSFYESERESHCVRSIR
ncbi:MAG: glycosyltransferase family 4 protein [Acidimicrobiales bacterium]